MVDRGVQQDVLTRIRVAQSEKVEETVASAAKCTQRPTWSRSRSVSAKGPLERRDYVLDGSGRRLRRRALNQLHLRVRCDIPALVCKDVQVFMTATHREELSVRSGKSRNSLRRRHEIPEVVLVLPTSRQEYIDREKRLDCRNRLEEKLNLATARSSRRDRAIRQTDDQSRPLAPSHVPPASRVLGGDNNRSLADDRG